MAGYAREMGEAERLRRRAELGLDQKIAVARAGVNKLLKHDVSGVVIHESEMAQLPTRVTDDGVCEFC